MQVVASPDKMVYSDGDKLNLDGLKVLLTDVNGNQKIFTYNSKGNKEFTDAGLSVDLKQDTEPVSYTHLMGTRTIYSWYCCR